MYLVLFLAVPLIAVMVMKKNASREAKRSALGAWRGAGEALAKCFWRSMLMVGGLYIMAGCVLDAKISDVASFSRKYRDSLPGAERAENRESEFEVRMAIAEAVRNRKNPPSEEAISERPEYRTVSWFCENYRWLNPLLPAAADIALLGILFMPGFKMKKQKTIV